MELIDLRCAALEIFESALKAADPRRAVRESLTVEAGVIRVGNEDIRLPTNSLFFAVAIGKAGVAMAAGLQDVLGTRIEHGIISGLPLDIEEFLRPNRWQIFHGGHPFPNTRSLIAAYTAMRLLEVANQPNYLVIFLISGGGSAMFEWPATEAITLEDLVEANRQLVSCGANIAEVNSVRRAFSAVKGGKLASFAPRANQITLIVSDTNPGDEANVASGPTLEPPANAPDPNEVIERYSLPSSLPESVLSSLTERHKQSEVVSASLRTPRHFVLLDNQTVLQAAHSAASRLGFNAEIAGDIREQEIAEGCELLLTRLHALSSRSSTQPVCLLSGGEFSCPVRGGGLGGRNSETVLRCAIQNERSRVGGALHRVFLSGGTDGIDGKSSAAGAIADETTIPRARSLGLNADEFLAKSDSFRFFTILGDAVTTGATGTNVRDLRILLSG